MLLALQLNLDAAAPPAFVAHGYSVLLSPPSGRASMAGGFFAKFPDEVIEFDVDASAALIGGDTIQSVSAAVVKGSVAASAAAFFGSIIHFTASGGSGGEVAQIVVKANLASGQIREALISILIKPLPAAA